MFGFILTIWPGGEGNRAEARDRDLVTAAQQGSADAFAALHTRYYSRIYRLALLKTNNASDAEDVASETFLRALSSLPRYRVNTAGEGTHSLYPWLHRIALNLIVDSSRQRPAAGMVSLDAPLVQGMRELLGDRLPQSERSASPQEIVERHEVQQLVRSAIDALPTDQGDVLIYRFLGDLSLKEIAPLMHRSESAVKSLLHRAVVALRGDLEQRIAAVEGRETVGQYGEKRSKEALQNVGGNAFHVHRRADD